LQEPHVLHRSVNCDGYVFVAIADTGPAVDLAISERIFDALYATKDGGFGLGLSICRKSSMPMEGSYGWRRTRSTG
jgi:signal transduction histidine kinase